MIIARGINSLYYDFVEGRRLLALQWLLLFCPALVALWFPVSARHLSVDYGAFVWGVVEETRQVRRLCH